MPGGYNSPVSFPKGAKPPRKKKKKKHTLWDTIKYLTTSQVWIYNITIYMGSLSTCHKTCKNLEPPILVIILSSCQPISPQKRHQRSMEDTGSGRGQVPLQYQSTKSPIQTSPKKFRFKNPFSKSTPYRPFLRPRFER